METQTQSIASQPDDYIYQLAAPTSISKNDVGILFAARASGLYYSRDNGQNWESAYKSLNAGQVLPTIAITLSPNFEHEPHIFAGLNGAILRSYDGGKNWQQCYLPGPPPVISSLITSPHYARDGIAFAGTNEDGVLLSTDRGKNWIAWNFGLLDLNILCLAISPDFATDETLYAGAVSGLFKSTNGGRAWREVALPIGYDAVLSLALSPKFTQDNTMYAGTENKGLLVSQDRGKSWQSLVETTGDQPVNSVLLSPNFPSDQEILLLHGGTLILTKDNGKIWKPWQKKITRGRNVTSLLVLHSFREGVFIGFEDGSVIKTQVF
jgi:photosystem II stability/assembly factor-like uncharacterized protein